MEHSHLLVGSCLPRQRDWTAAGNILAGAGQPQDQRGRACADVHSHSTTTGTTHHDIGPVLVKFGLGDGGGEVIIGQSQSGTNPRRYATSRTA